MFRTLGLWMGEAVVRKRKGAWVATNQCSDFTDCRVEFGREVLDPFKPALESIRRRSGDPIRDWTARTLEG